MADKLRTARTITLNGDVTGSTTFDGSGDVTITAAVAADSHAHDTQYLRRDGNNTMTGNLTFSDNTFCKDILINGAVKQHRLSAYDNAASNAVWIFSSRENGATNWKSLLTISMDGTVSASTFKGALNGNADTASKFKTAQTITVAGDATGTVTFDGSKAQTLSLDVGSADQLSSNYKINGTAFNGSKDITTASWGAARNVSITDGTNTGTATSMGTATSGSYSLKLPTTIKAALDGNAKTATQLATARTISLAGDVTGSVSFNGAENVTINTEVANDSHDHTFLLLKGSLTNQDLNSFLNDRFEVYRATGDSVVSNSPVANGTGFGLLCYPGASAYRVQELTSSAGTKYIRTITATTRNPWKQVAFITDNVASADKWKTARTLTLKGGANGNVSFDGSENVECEVTITDDSHAHDSQYLRRDGANYMTGNINIVAGSENKYLAFWSAFNNVSNWRLGYQGEGHGDSNYFVLQSSTDTIDTWTDALKFGNRTLDATFAGKVTAASFVGNASSSSKWATARTITLTGGATGSVSIDGSENKNLEVTVTNDGHRHSNSTIDSLDASKITSGTISISRLPQGALERLVVVADDTARFKLTTSNVQLGDVVKVTATDVMYFVKDTANLGNANGYELFAAGRAASVDWANIQNVPTLSLAGDATGTIDLSGVAANGKVLNVTIADDSHAHNSQYLRRDGTNYMTGNVTILTGNTDKFIEWKYETSNYGASWRMGYLGSGSSDTNYFVIQNTTSSTSTTAMPWLDIMKITMNTKATTFAGSVTATSFIGNASSATKLETTRSIGLGGHVTGSASFNGTKDIVIDVTVSDDSHLHTKLKATGFGGNSSAAGLVPEAGGYAKFFYGFASQTPGVFPSNNYANTILAISRHNNANYNSQLGFSSNGSIYYRAENGTAFTDAVEWKKLAFTSDNVASADKWSTARTLTLTGDVTGETTIDGSGNISMEATVLDDSHAHNYIGKNRYIAYPSGSTYYVSGTSTGALQITLPVKWTNNMLKFTVSIYNYVTGTSVDYIINGYNYTTGQWYHPTAVCLGKAGSSLSNLKVRYCTDGTYPCVTIGEVDTEWSYISVSIHDITWGNASNYTDLIKNWTIATVTTLPTVQHTVENTHVGYNSVASSCLGNAATASKWATARTLTLSGDVTGSVTFDGSGAISLSTTVGDDSHLHDCRYVKLAGSTMTGNLVLPVGADVYNNASLYFGTKTRIGTGTNNTFGIYSTGNINLRPNNGTLGYADGIEISPTSVIPTKNNTVTLGDSTHTWKTVYGNATSASKWATARTITVAGDATGSVSIDGSANKTLTLDVASAAKTDYALTVNVTNVAGTLTTTTFNGSAAKTINIDATDFMPLTSFTKSLTLNTNWQDIGISGNNIPSSGSYIIQIYLNDGSSDSGTTLANYTEYYTGVMSWWSGSTNSTDTDEIILHKAGHASNSRYLYLRTVRTSAGILKMQVAANVTATAPSTLQIKVRQLI